MGCNASVATEKVPSIDSKRNISNKSSEGKSRRIANKSVRATGNDDENVWKVVPTVAQARDKYEADGTLTKQHDDGHLELRQLLEEPMGQNYIGAFAKEVKTQESFMCWVDIQEFKFIPTDDYRRSKGLHIYHKYVKPGAILQLGSLESSEIDNYKELLELSKSDSKLITKDFYDQVQIKCFHDMFQNVYLKFKKSPK
jgi:hypothetical protein